MLHLTCLQNAMLRFGVFFSSSDAFVCGLPKAFYKLSDSLLSSSGECHYLHAALKSSSTCACQKSARTLRFLQICCLSIYVSIYLSIYLSISYHLVSVSISISTEGPCSLAAKFVCYKMPWVRLGWNNTPLLGCEKSLTKRNGQLISQASYHTDY